MKKKFQNHQTTPNPDEITQHNRMLHAMNSVAEILFLADEDNFKDSLLEAMELMGDCMKVDRIYIWKNIMKDGLLQYIQQFEWLNGAPGKGLTVRAQEGFSYKESMPEWEEKFLNGECVNGSLSNLSQTERERLEPYGIKSILVTPVYFRNFFWGFVSFDDCHQERTFTDDEVNILRSANLLLANAMYRHETASMMREANEHTRLMLEAMPLCCSLWEMDKGLVTCNDEAVNLYKLKNKQEYLEKFFELSPEYQPDGSLSKQKALEHIETASREGKIVFEWIHQMLDGTPIPAEITLARVKRGDEFIISGYTRDLREHKKMMKAIEYKDALLHTVNEAASILLQSGTNEFEENLLRCMGMMADSVNADRVYIWKNYEKEDQLYTSQIYEWSGNATSQQGGRYAKDIPYSEFPAWKRKLSAGECINGLVRRRPANEKSFLSRQGILSILVVPVFLRDNFWGFVGFDDCHSERIFTKEEESILRSASLLITNALLRNEMTHDIEAAVEQAQAASKAKSSFLAHMSHELRTPMNVIAGMSELVLREDKNIPASIYDQILNIKHASSNMLSLISDILDFSRIEAGSLDIITVQYSLTSLINNVLNIIRMRISEKPIIFTVNIDCNIPNRLVGDETRIRQILLNLLDNAVKYTAEGFISLTVSGRVDGDTVVLKAEVSDSGIGIREDDIGMLFEDFMRFEGERHKEVQGTGLGLPITKSLCQAMGGNISVSSEYGTGSVFTIEIPQEITSSHEKFANVSDPETKSVLLYEKRPVCAGSIIRSLNNLGVPCTLVKNQKEFCEELKRQPYSFAFVSSMLSESAVQIIEELKPDTVPVLLMDFGEAPSMHNVRTISMPAHSASIAYILDDTEGGIFYNDSNLENVRFIAPSANILVVDDLNTNLKVAHGLMLPYQMQIDVCESGAEAITLVHKKRYDIIFMDHMMPEMDGIEATRRIRSLDDANSYYGNVPIIALTANAVSGVKEMFLQNGMNDFLAKPIDIAKLHALLEKWLPEEKKEKFGETRIKRVSEETISAGFQIEGIDVQSGLSMAGENPEGYLKTLSSFHADGSEKINKIRDNVEKNDIKSYKIIVHALKSASASIGAWEISDLFKALETAASKGDLKFIHENTGQTLYELEKLLKNIETVISNNSVEMKKENDPEVLKRELLKLREALDNRDAGEIEDIMNILGTEEWDKQTGEIFKEISKNILLINYDGAAVLVDKLTESIQ